MNVRRRYQRFLRRLGPIAAIQAYGLLAKARALTTQLIVLAAAALAVVVAALYAVGDHRRPGFAAGLTDRAVQRRRNTLFRRLGNIIAKRHPFARIAALVLALAFAGAAHADGFSVLSGLTVADLERLITKATATETPAEPAEAAAEEGEVPPPAAARDGKSLAAVVVATIEGDFDQGIAYPVARFRSPRDPRYHWHIDALALSKSVGLGAARELYASGREALSLGIAATIPLSATRVQDGATVAVYGRLTIGP